MKLYIVVANGMPKKCPKFDYPRLDSMDTVGQTNTKVSIFLHFVIQMTRNYIQVHTFYTISDVFQNIQEMFIYNIKGYCKCKT